MDDQPLTVQPKLDPASELAAMRDAIQKSTLPDKLKENVERLIFRLEQMSLRGIYSGEFEPVEKYVNWILQIPFGKYTQDNLDLNQAKAVLDSSHYGLNAVKEKILEFISVMNLKAARGQLETGGTEIATSTLRGNSANAPVILFVGVQGIGKTSITKSIAQALGRQMVRIPLGALADSALIKGVPRGNSNSEPGLITKALIKAGTMNPVILLDEIDKVSDKAGGRADLMAALLEILDPEQNYAFTDNFVDYPLDLSKCFIICTANNLAGITAAVLDRLEVIRLNSYNDDEKKHIARDYLLPKVRNATGITEQQLYFAEDAWDMIIRPLGFDAGVRQLERTLTDLARKIARKIVNGEGTTFEINAANFREFIPADIGVYS